MRARNLKTMWRSFVSRNQSCLTDIRAIFWWSKDVQMGRFDRQTLHATSTSQLTIVNLSWLNLMHHVHINCSWHRAAVLFITASSHLSKMSSVNGNFYSWGTKLPVSHFGLWKRLRAASEWAHVFWRRQLIGNQLAEKANGCSPAKTAQIHWYCWSSITWNII